MTNKKEKVGNCVFPVSVDTVVFGEGIGRIDIQSYQILTETFYLR